MGALTVVADKHGALGGMLRYAVSSEVAVTSSAGTLFRGNTIATRLLVSGAS